MSNRRLDLRWESGEQVLPHLADGIPTKIGLGTSAAPEATQGKVLQHWELQPV